MNTQTHTVDVTHTANIIAVYSSTTTRAVENAARATARHIVAKLTTLRAAIDASERMLALALEYKRSTSDETLRAEMHKRVVVLAHACNIIRQNDSKTLQRALASSTRRRAVRLTASEIASV